MLPGDAMAPAENAPPQGHADLWSVWDHQLGGADPPRAVERAPSRMYAASAATLVATLVILCVVAPNFVLHRPASALRSRTIVLSRVLIVSLVAAGVVVGAPLAISAWRGRVA